MVPGVVFSEVQGEMVLFHTVNGRYYGLDAVGSRIWHLLQCESDLGRLHARLIEEYDACGVLPWSDVAAVVEALAARGLVAIVEPDRPEGFHVQPLDSEAPDVARGRHAAGDA